MPLRDIAVFVAVLGSLPFCFLFPFFGIVMWTVLAFLNPQQLAWGQAHQLPVALMVAIPTLLGFLLFSFRLKPIFSRDGFLLIALWLWFTLTTLKSVQDPVFAGNAPDTWAHWQLVSKILLMTVLTFLLVQNWSRLRWLTLAIAGCFGLFILKIVPFLIASGGSFRIYGPGDSMLADNNDFGLALNMTLPIFFCLARTEADRRIRWLMGFLFVATIPAIFFTYSRGAMIGLVAVLIMMGLQLKKKVLLLVPVLALIGVSALLLAPQKWKARMDPTQNMDASALSRINAWTYSWRLAQDYPLMGGGFDDFTPELFQRYAPNPEDVHGPHSVYFGVLAEHGFLGLGLYLIVLGNALLRLSGIKKSARRLGDARAWNYAMMFQLSLIGFMASGAFLGRAYFDYYFTILACVAALTQICHAQWRQRIEFIEAEPSWEEAEITVAPEAAAF